MKQFNELGLAEPILRALTENNYNDPTPIQGQVIPAMMAGNDIVGIAQTGTGKTAAFVLPILNRLAKVKDRPAPKTCRSLIVAPTRELALQIAENVRKYAKHMHLSCTVVMGGVKAGPQIKGMSRGVDVLVATPGRLLDHMDTGAISIKTAQVVILDEADQMLDMGFIPAIRKIMRQVPKDRQTGLFSATMPPAIRSLANDFLRDPQEISVAPVSTPIERIEQKVMPVSSADKRSVLTKLIRDDETVERAIVFTRTKHGADRVCKHLEKAGISAGAIHGNRNQNQRQRTLGDFKTGAVKILVATDVAARGIDIPDVSHVFNFELPNVPESYVHRIGRTARAGKEGIAISLCAPDEKTQLRDIERLIGVSFGLPGMDQPAPKKKSGGGRGHRGQGANTGQRPGAPKTPGGQGRKRRRSGGGNSGNGGGGNPRRHAA